MSIARLKDRLTDPSMMSSVTIQSKQYTLLDYSSGGFAVSVDDVNDLASYGKAPIAAIYFQGSPLITARELSVRHITAMGNGKWKVGLKFNSKLDRDIMKMLTTVGHMRPHYQRERDAERGVKL